MRVPVVIVYVHSNRQTSIRKNNIVCWGIMYQINTDISVYVTGFKPINERTLRKIVEKEMVGLIFAT